MYENLPRFCGLCCIVGHDDRNCWMLRRRGPKGKKEWKPIEKGQAKPIIPMSEKEEIEASGNTKPRDPKAVIQVDGGLNNPHDVPQVKNDCDMEHNVQIDYSLNKGKAKINNQNPTCGAADLITYRRGRQLTRV
ncbi:hypothetical protein Dimus_004193 [Dionaea muscipula]